MPEIAWQSRGGGPPLVMVNGYAASGSEWDPTLIGELAREFTVICPDNRGTGRSAPIECPLSIGSMAADLLAVLDRLGTGRVALLGWSMGGFIAQELAARAPGRISALVLLASDGGGSGAILACPAVTARLFDHSGSAREQASRLIELLFPPSLASEIDARFGELVAAARAALPAGTLEAQERAMAAWHEAASESRLAAITAPTLVMSGEEDVVIPAANAPLLAAAIAGAKLRSFAGAGHGFIAQEAPSVAAAIREFLAEADSERR